MSIPRQFRELSRKAGLLPVLGRLKLILPRIVCINIVSSVLSIRTTRTHARVIYHVIHKLYFLPSPRGGRVSTWYPLLAQAQRGIHAGRTAVCPVVSESGGSPWSQSIIKMYLPTQKKEKGSHSNVLSYPKRSRTTFVEHRAR